MPAACSASNLRLGDGPEEGSRTVRRRQRKYGLFRPLRRSRGSRDGRALLQGHRPRGRKAPRADREVHGGRVPRRVRRPAVDAVDAAAAVHTSLADDNATRPEGARVRIHSGVSVGPVVVRGDGDVFGDTVNVAARVQHVAGPGSIYVTKEVIDRSAARHAGADSPRGLVPAAREGRRGRALRGRCGSSKGRRCCSRARRCAKRRCSPCSSKARWRRWVRRRARLTVGRISGNDLVVDDGAVSREHAEFVRRKGTIYLSITRRTGRTCGRRSASRGTSTGKSSCSTAAEKSRSAGPTVRRSSTRSRNAGSAPTLAAARIELAAAARCLARASCAAALLLEPPVASSNTQSERRKARSSRTPGFSRMTALLDENKVALWQNHQYRHQCNRRESIGIRGRASAMVRIAAEHGRERS